MRVVAIKALSIAKPDLPVEVPHEFFIAGHLEPHENLVRMYEYMHYSSVQYIVMKACESVDLSRRCTTAASSHAPPALPRPPSAHNALTPPSRGGPRRRPHPADA